MSANTAELTLLLKAKNLADIELGKLRASMDKVTVTARQVASDVSDAFKRVGARIAGHLGNLATDILSGGSIQNSLLAVGATMAGAMVEGLSARFIPMVLEKAMTTAAFAPLAAAMAEGGVTLGSVLATAIGVGVAAMPFILLAAAVAALVYLATNPEARQKAHDIALMILGRIGDGLRALPGLIADIFRNAMGLAGDIVRNVVGFIVRVFLNIPNAIGAIGKMLVGVIGGALDAVFTTAKRIIGAIVNAILGIVKAVGDALAALGLLKSHTPQQNIDYHTKGTVPGSAAGGWVGLRGPEIRRVGEEGPEYVVPNHRLQDMGGGGEGFRIVGVSKRDLARIVDEQMYVLIQRAVPTIDRR